MSEEWKQIEEFPNYSISNMGRVRNDRIQRIRNDEVSVAGYIIVSLKNKEGKTRQRFIHRLVALAFLPNPDNKPSVDHINRIKTDNRVDNLRWATHSENGMNIDVHLSNKLQEKNIFYAKHHRGKKYCVSKKVHGKTKRIYCHTLEEAIIYRNILDELSNAF